MTVRTRLVCLALALNAGALGCGSDSEDFGGAPSSPGTGSASGGSAGSFGGVGTGGTGGGGLPPEVEIESAYRAPVVTGHYVWSANPESGRIAVIDPETLVVRLAEAGFEPTELTALPGDDSDRALVINSGSHDVTLLEADSETVTAVLTLPVHRDANAWSVSPSGRFAVAWTNSLAIDAPDPSESFQDVTVFDLDAEKSFELSVGYRPSQIAFDAAESRAFVVTEPGLSVIELATTPRVSSLLELTSDPVDSPASRDVSITADGALALVRVEGKSTLGVVDLASGALSAVDLGGEITDVDLSPEGDRAFAVVANQLVVLPVPPVAAAVPALPRATFGSEALRSVSPATGGNFAVLYTNAVANAHVGVAVSEDGWQSSLTRVVDVKAEVRSALASPDGRHAIVLGRTPLGSSKAGAFAIVPAQMDRTIKVIGTDAEPKLVTFAPSSDHALLAVRDDARVVHGAYLVDLGNLAETFVPLSSPPSAVGIIAQKKRAFVAQLHPEGRITFLDLTTGAAHTLTGFELAAKVSGE